MREHQPETVAACLRERGRHPLRQMTEAVALVHQAQERRAVAVRERAESLRGLPRAMQQHRSDQVRRVLTEGLRE